MESIFYTVKETNTINKTMENAKRYVIKFKEKSSILNPKIVLRDENFLEIVPNYFYIPKFKRYYFIENIQVTPNNLFEIDGKVDVLESFKNDILNSYCTLKSSKEKENLYYNRQFENQINKEIDIYNCDFKLENKQNVILITIGGK